MREEVHPQQGDQVRERPGEARPQLEVLEEQHGDQRRPDLKPTVSETKMRGRVSGHSARTVVSRVANSLSATSTCEPVFQERGHDGAG
jgi:hypothetical protein